MRTLSPLVCLVSFLVSGILLPSSTGGQQSIALLQAPAGQSQATVATVRDSIHILYTGKLFGYFRNPDAQAPDALTPCRDGRDRRSSAAARQFSALVRDSHVERPIVLGMGDNFSPEVEARKFCQPPANQYKTDKSRFNRSGKEYFVWDGQNWQTNEYVSGPKGGDLDLRLQKGLGFVPNDNVAGFFVDQGYAAIVPGKHDFYYGAERLRELAVFLASSRIDNPSTIHMQGVQMLGSNLVIETTWKSGHEPLSDHKQPPWFIPRFPTARDLVKKPAAEIKFSGISDGGAVYPWFQGPRFSLSTADAELESTIKLFAFFFCELSDGDPDARPDAQKCTRIFPSTPDHKGNYQLQFPWKGGKTWSTLRPGANYLFCAEGPVYDAQLKDKDGGHKFCLRFSTYVPLLQFTASDTGDCSNRKPGCQIPQPFVLLPKGQGLAQDVAVFGVVDPHLPDYVGLLNLSWHNINEDYKTTAAVKDPAEALREMDDYFESKYKDDHHGESFSGVKVLLAQMSPQEAELLAARVGKYQVIVSEADAERAGYDHATTLDWKSTAKKATSASAQSPAKFLAVPEPFYDEKRNETEGSSWNVDIGSLTIHFPAAVPGEWHFATEHLSSPVMYDTKGPASFWAAVEQRVKQHCLPDQVARGTEQKEQIQWLTLCAMQEQSEADIAFLQQRDFFPVIAEEPHEPGQKEALLYSFQDMVDRVIWKGDFLVVSHIPGSIIQKLMAQSKTYDTDDKSLLSLSDERNRGLVFVGIHYDAEQSEYVVNGLPLYPNKLYSVVTSDFVTGGDTGYPDLAGAQANPPMTLNDLDRRLRKISSVVCNKLAGDIPPGKECLGPISRDDYFDDVALAPPNTKKVKTNTKQLKQWSVFFPPGPVPGDVSLSNASMTLSAHDAADQHVEQRRLWDFALNKWTLGITALGHNSSDYDVQNDFSGVSAPGVSAVRSSTWSSDLQAQYTRSWENYQILLIPAYTFNTQYKGQPDDSRQINQQSDLGMFDLAGVYLWNGRGAEHFDSILTAHFETPLARIFNAFPLATTHLGAHDEPIKDQLRFAQDRSYTELLRPGFRWLRRKSWLEAGPEWGHEWNALEGFQFLTEGTTTTCLATETTSISQCVKTAVKANPTSIAPGSEVTSLRSGHNHAGMYWKFTLTVPFHPRVSYVFTDTGDWFFVHFHTDNSTDTRFRDTEQHQLKLTLFPSLSIGPEVDLLFYENASAGKLAGHFLRQDQVMMKAQFSFDLFNRRKLWQEIKYAPPAK